MITTHIRILVLMVALSGVTPAAAQMPTSSSAVHTVSVTVPPRVRVQVRNLAAASIASRASESPNGMSLSVTATQGWVLAIETRGTMTRRRAEWSRHDGRGFTDLFVRGATSGASDPIVLTLTTP